MTALAGVRKGKDIAPISLQLTTCQSNILDFSRTRLEQAGLAPVWRGHAAGDHGLSAQNAGGVRWAGGVSQSVGEHVSDGDIDRRQVVFH